MKNNIFILFTFFCINLFSQKHVFSLSYSNQVGVNQFNSIQNDFHNNDKMYSGYSSSTYGLSFDRKINEKQNLWLHFSASHTYEMFKFDYYYLFSKPEHDPFNYLTQADFDALPERGGYSQSWLQIVDFQLSLKKTFKSRFWNVEIQPEIGLYSRSDYGFYTGFQYASIIIKLPYYYTNITRFRTDNPSNSGKVFGFVSMNVNKTFWNKMQVGLDLSYFPRIKMDYEVGTVINISGFDDNNVSQLQYFQEINSFTKAQLVYDLFRFGLKVGYLF